jgi:conjugal transfer pilus assembly protein TraB
MAEENLNPARVKRKQQFNLLIGLILVGLLLCGLYFVLESKAPPANPTETMETVAFESSLSHVDGEAMWVERAQNQLAEAQKATEALKEQLQLLQQAKETQDKTTQDQVSKVEKLTTEVNILQKELADQKKLTASPFLASNMPIASNIHHEVLPLKPRHQAQSLPSKNALTFVPAGTFVRAISLGGADASAGVSSQADPTPMLFRLLDFGTLPNHRHSQLKNCIATAAAVGDVSSERGQIRLERLSCVKANGEVLDIAVEGTIFGPDGKNGVRGNPVWREGALLKRAFAAGTLSGFSNGLSQSATASSFNAFGNAQTLVDSHKVSQFGLTSGLSNAAEKLAEYNIKRAEQYHPVIQLSAGTLVDIVFLKGFYLDGRKSEGDEDLLAPSPPPTNEVHLMQATSQEALAEKSVNENASPAPLPLTPKQIDSLKEKNAELGYF